jgi:hypothetical protein
MGRVRDAVRHEWISWRYSGQVLAVAVLVAGVAGLVLSMVWSS